MQVAVADRDWPLVIPAPCKTKFQDKASRGESWHPEVLKAFGSLCFNAWLGTYLVASLHLNSGEPLSTTDIVRNTHLLSYHVLEL